MTFDGLAAVLVIFLYVALPVAIFAFIISVISKYGHRKNRLMQNVVITEYEPPEGMSPAEIGYLFDSDFDQKEVLATLIDLEQKKLIITDRADPHKITLAIETGEASATLKEHEHFILKNLASDASFDPYRKRSLSTFKGAVKNSLSKAGYIKSQKENINYYVQRTAIAYLAIIAVTTLISIATSDSGVLPVIIFMAIISVLGFPFVLGLAVIAGFIYNKIVGQPGLWTKKLKRIWPQIEGYREYVRQVELNRLRFESKESEARIRNEALPYAVALGFDID